MDLGTLTVTLPTNLSGTIPVILEVHSTLGASATQYFAHQMTVAAVADAPIGSAANIRGQLGQTIPFNLFSALTDSDGSENISLGVRGIPFGMRITDGVHSAIGTEVSSWIDITGWQMNQLRLETAGGVNAGYGLTFRIISTEQSNGSIAATNIGFTLTVDQVLPLTDNPVISASANTLAIDAVEVLATDSESDVATTVNANPIVTSQIASSLIVDYIPVDDMNLAAIVQDEFQQQPSVRRLRTSNSISSVEDFPLRALPELGYEVIEHLETGNSSLESSDSYQATENSDTYRLIEQEAIELAATSQNEESFQQSRLANGLLAFWNLMRSHASGLLTGSLTNREPESIDEQRMTSRSTKRDDEEN